MLQGHALNFDSGSEGMGSVPNSMPGSPRAGSVQGHPVAFDSGSELGSPFGSSAQTPIGSGASTPMVRLRRCSHLLSHMAPAFGIILNRATMEIQFGIVIHDWCRKHMG